MTAVYAEQQKSEIHFSDAILNAAEAHAVSLAPERVQNLVSIAESSWRYGRRDGALYAFQDSVNDVTVTNPTVLEQFGSPAAQVDFAPILEGDGDFVIGDTSARPDRATRYTLMALQGLQNYALLVDAGIIEKPAILFGDTNPEMAIVAERMGMLTDIARQHDSQPDPAHKAMRQVSTKLRVYGSFEEVRERLFSENTQKLERLLTRRLTTEQAAGAVALQAST